MAHANKLPEYPVGYEDGGLPVVEETGGVHASELQEIIEYEKNATHY